MDYETFKAHGIWAEADGVSETIDDINLSDEMVPVAARAEAIAGHVLSFRTSAHAALLSAQMLSAPVSHLANVRNYLDNGRYDYADRELDSVLGVVSQWGTLLPPAKQAEQARAATEALTQVIERRLRKFSDQEQRFAHEASTLTVQVQTASERLKEIESATQSALAAQQEKFTEAQLSRIDAHKEEVKETARDLSQMLEVSKDLVGSWETELKENAERAQRKLESIEKIVGKTAAAILARDHGTYANREFAFGLVAYVVGIAGIVWGATVVLSGLAEVQASAETVTWQWLAAKLSFGAIVGAGSTVAFRLGGRFIKSSTAMKRRELELRAIIPFLAEVDPKKAEDAKLAFLDRTFGREPEEPQKKSDPSEEAIPASLFERVATIITAANRAS